jgi:hypothetical protein
MVTPTVTELRRNGNPVGRPVEPAHRATPAAGQSMRYGQRPDGFTPIAGLAAGLDDGRLGHVAD